MKFEWAANKADLEIGYYTCRLLDDNGVSMGRPEIHLTDYTCPWRDEQLKHRLDTEPHTSLLLAQAKVAYEWTYCYGNSLTERYMRDEGLTLKDAMALVEEQLIEMYLGELNRARQTVKDLSRVEEFASSRNRTAPFRFTSGTEMLKTLQTHDLYNPDANMYVFLYNEVGSIVVYDNIDREEAIKLGSDAENMDEYWGAFLGWGGDIYDDPSYENYNPELCSNLDFCADNFAQGRWYDTKGWFEANRSEPEKEKMR